MKLGNPEETTIEFKGNVCNRTSCSGEGTIDVTTRPHVGKLNRLGGMRRVITGFAGCISCEACGLRVEASADGANLIGVRGQLNSFIRDVGTEVVDSKMPNEDSTFKPVSTLAAVNMPMRNADPRFWKPVDLAVRIEREL